MHQNYEKFEKSAVFEAGNPLEMGPDLRKFQTNRHISFLEGEKSLEMGKGFRPRAAHPVEKSFEYPPGIYSIIQVHRYDKYQTRHQLRS